MRAEAKLLVRDAGPGGSSGLQSLRKGTLTVRGIVIMPNCSEILLKLYEAKNRAICVVVQV